MKVTFGRWCADQYSQGLAGCTGPWVEGVRYWALRPGPRGYAVWSLENWYRLVEGDRLRIITKAAWDRWVEATGGPAQRGG